MIKLLSIIKLQKQLQLTQAWYVSVSAHRHWTLIQKSLDFPQNTCQ